MIVLWSPEAIKDRRDNLLYIAERNVTAALGQGELIAQQVDGLAEFPDKGRPGRRSGTRELVISGTPFIAIYRIKPRLKRIEILRMLHGAQQWPKPVLK